VLLLLLHACCAAAATTTVSCVPVPTVRLAFSAVKCTVPKWQRRERRERQEERIDERRNERREERGFMYVKPTFITLLTDVSIN